MSNKLITLGINTTTRDCSVALLVDDKEFIAREYNERGHEGVILGLMDKLLHESGVTKNELELLAFGQGPGAFTGIRVATATVQGLAFGLKLPVVPVSDLLNISYQHFLSTGQKKIIACVDARMDEVYAAGIEWSDSGFSYFMDETLLKPENLKIDSPDEVVGIGNGFEVFPDLIESLKIKVEESNFELVPTGLAAAQLSRMEFLKGNTVEAGDALPVYLRNEVAWKQ